uniref:THAP-type domain-containing protein n=1 Tax=Gouania willdenowi TaxID=441366 RepID=A0A8C5E6D7_GOUWI
MPERCCAVGCYQICDPTKGISSHRIPKKSKRRSKWLVGINRQNADGGIWLPTQHMQLCRSKRDKQTITNRFIYNFLILKPNVLYLPLVISFFG